jgi:acyl-[acyl-carrier-protein]-phospholipid O-acyltransferase/long-chain-fatty-acid--[acyl-carrier-protein] ligase
VNNLLRTAGSLPFLTAVFLNAFIDLGHKIVIQNTIFKLYDGPEQVILTAIVNGLILLPFILLFTPAGFFSDKYPKNHIMRFSAWGAVGLTIAITFCYALGWFWSAFAMTFLLAMQSAFYSPAKNGYLKVLFGKQRLAQANGVAQAVTIVAILAGTLVFSVAFEYWYTPDTISKNAVLQNLVPVGFLLIANSVIELLMVYRLPLLERVKAEKTFNIVNFLNGKSATENVKILLTRPEMRQAMIGLAVFWSVGQVMLATFPAFAKSTLGETNTIIIQAILGASGVGIALGSVLAGRLSRNYIEMGLVPVGAVGFALGLCFLPYLNSYWAMALIFLWIGIMGGFFIVPLNALIQFYAKEDELGKLLSTSNLVQNLSMLFFLAVTVSFSLLNWHPKSLLIFISIVAVVGGSYTVLRLPQSLVRILFSYFFPRRYRIDVQGVKNIPEQGGVLLLGNHISWIDWAIVQIACPRPVRFVMIKTIYDRWYWKWFFKLFGCIPIQADASSRQTLHQLAELLNQGEVVCLFPEGILSRNGHLAEFRPGFERAVSLCNDDIVILPFYIHGLWGSQFSNSSDNLKNWRSNGIHRHLIMAFGEPLPKETDTATLKQRVFDLSTRSWQTYAKKLPTLPNAWIETVKKQTKGPSIIDTLGQSLSAKQALTAAVALSRKIKRQSSEKNIGLLLPNSAGGVLANMAILLRGKTVVNLNYTASQDAFCSALEQANIKTIYTSKRFLDKLAKRDLDFGTVLSSYRVIFLEDVKQSITKWPMLTIFLTVKFLPAWCLKALYSRANQNRDTAAILFSSGSEGLPKGIELSHMNIMVNLKQVADVLDPREDDVIMASLPSFHAFGLTVTQLMPLIEGLPMVCHADPTDALGSAKAIAKYRVTIMCATSTFLRLYCRNTRVHPLMLGSLRIVVSGAERLSPHVREAFKQKFNKEIYEGYGTTETSPVASVNIPDVLSNQAWKVQVGNKVGSVGMPLPGTSFKIVDPESFEELPRDSEGMVLIGGAQVMQNYLNKPEKTAQVIREIDNIRWYVSGDKGYLDADGFLTIVDRYSRFAKLGGEMVSLTMVESKVIDAIGHINPEMNDVEVMAVNVSDEKKGEKIILLTELTIDQASIKEVMLVNGCNPLAIPSAVVAVEQLPKLGSGKADFANAKRLASTVMTTNPE